MKLAYKPFSLILGLLAGMVATRIFDAIWERIDDQDAPEPSDREADMAKILLAAALQGVIFKGTRAAVERGAARGWSSFFGVWPGDERPEPAEA
jgi:hypothetical protein